MLAIAFVVGLLLGLFGGHAYMRRIALNTQEQIYFAMSTSARKSYWKAVEKLSKNG